MSFPKYLVELDHADYPDGFPDQPLWVCRTRDPFCLGQILLTEKNFGLNFWPAIVEGNRKSLASKLTRAWCREFDVYPGDLPSPEIFREIVDPPEFINMIRPGSEAEFILDPHAPRLWRVWINRNQDTTGATWVPGFGSEPEFPRDTRRVSKFLQKAD